MTTGPAGLGALVDRQPTALTIDGAAPLSAATRLLEQHPDAPGCLVTIDDEAWKMLSRATLSEHLATPYFRESYWQKPVREWLRRLQLGLLVLDGATPVAAAVSTALARHDREAYEPIAVRAGDGSLRVLDMHRLLVQQNRQLSEAMAEVARQRDAADRATRSKSEFLANMSHEIRTPMTAILGYAELLRDPKTQANERSEYVDTIRRNGQHLLAVINDILDLTKIESGRMDIERVPTSVAAIAGEVVSLLRVRAEAKGLDLRLDFATPVPERAAVDPVKLQQILTNLIGNAIKFTDRGSVSLIVSFDRDAQRCRFEVVDTGIGMTAAQLQRLFVAFQQADTSTTRRFGGTGLGLAISRRLAMMLGGDITVRSRAEHGSTFTLEIVAEPAADSTWHDDPREALRCAAGRTAGDHAPRLDGRRILLAEDGPDNRLLIAKILRNAGGTVEVAENGARAVELALDGSHDLILMDMQMPELDGYGAARTLRDHGYRKPIIALTAQAMSGDRERCIDAGCDDYATKPVQRERLLELIALWTRATPTR